MIIGFKKLKNGSKSTPEFTNEHRNSLYKPTESKEIGYMRE